MPRSECKTCASPDQEHIEAIGLQCLKGERSWRNGIKELGWNDIRPLQFHMNNHFMASRERELEAVEEAAEDELQAHVDEAVLELFQQMRMAPPEVKGLYATAIQNLRGLRETKPSQQHLIMALKAIQEMTGMKQEQRLLVQFAEHMFRELPNKAQEALPPAPVYIDVEETH